MKVPIEVSARHVHLSKTDMETLFGINHVLIPKRDLSQPGEFLCEEKVEIMGPKSSIKNVSVLGPCRINTQVELSTTDLIRVGIDIFIRESGDLSGTPGCTLLGPCGTLRIEEGVIAAKRHIHMDLDTASRFLVKNGELVKLKICSSSRSLIFGDIVVRVSGNYKLACHLDTDEANAAEIKDNFYGEMIKIV